MAVIDDSVNTRRCGDTEKVLLDASPVGRKRLSRLRVVRKWLPLAQRRGVETALGAPFQCLGAARVAKT